ncbi:MAG: diadenosine tetraphosphate (Ap4A) HIT family hydrolase [Cyclobacteriaceae bacterium]|jgi:diadenosine tetraphosphate (Ap4A) HIT family hydrolase
MEFQIHPILLADCHYISKLNSCYLLLHKNAVVPWFILVPEVENDWFDLDINHQSKIIEEANLVASFIKHFFVVDKLNFAAIGNVVPQLHLHVVGRSKNDSCWPQPVWGNLKTFETYLPKDLLKLKEDLGQYIL